MTQLKAEPVSDEQRKTAVSVLLALAQDETVADDIRFSAASTILHAPAYEMQDDAVEDLVTRIAERLNVA